MRDTPDHRGARLAPLERRVGRGKVAAIASVTFLAGVATHLLPGL